MSRWTWLCETQETRMCKNGNVEELFEEQKVRKCIVVLSLYAMNASMALWIRCLTSPICRYDVRTTFQRRIYAWHSIGNMTGTTLPTRIGLFVCSEGSCFLYNNSISSPYIFLMEWRSWQQSLVVPVPFWFFEYCGLCEVHAIMQETVAAVSARERERNRKRKRDGWGG